jgi:hypothetical protein
MHNAAPNAAANAAQTTGPARSTRKAIVMSKHNVTFKVSVKGAISVYGLQQFPVTLYPDQWASIMESGLPQFVAEQAKAATEQQERYLAAKVVAERRGLTKGKEMDDFISKLLGFESKTVSGNKAQTPRASLVDELMRKASA